MKTTMINTYIEDLPNIYKGDGKPCSLRSIKSGLKLGTEKATEVRDELVDFGALQVDEDESLIWDSERYNDLLNESTSVLEAHSNDQACSQDFTDNKISHLSVPKTQAHPTDTLQAQPQAHFGHAPDTPTDTLQTHSDSLVFTIPELNPNYVPEPKSKLIPENLSSEPASVVIEESPVEVMQEEPNQPIEEVSASEPKVEPWKAPIKLTGSVLDKERDRNAKVSKFLINKVSNGQLGQWMLKRIKAEQTTHQIDDFFSVIGSALMTYDESGYTDFSVLSGVPVEIKAISMVVMLDAGLVKKEGKGFRWCSAADLKAIINIPVTGKVKRKLFSRKLKQPVKQVQSSDDKIHSLRDVGQLIVDDAMNSAKWLKNWLSDQMQEGK